MSALARLLGSTFRGALHAIDLRALTRDALLRAKIRRPAYVVAVGKASLAMAKGANDALRASGVAELLAIAPDGLALPRVKKHAFYMHASHPLPDARSVVAAKRALALAERAKAENATLIVLVSGGASSLMAWPHERISLDKKRQIVSALLRAGAPIADLNVVRRHLSRIKGGSLLHAAGDARVVTILVSDVLSNAAHDIGSGPSVIDPTSIADARRVLHRYRIANAALAETVKSTDEGRGEGGRGERSARGKGSDVVIVASPSLFASTFRDLILARGFTGKMLSPSDALADALIDEYVQIASKLKPGEFVVRAAEPQVRVARTHGRGGRASHVAALLATRLPRDVAFLAGATDGRDGTSDAAGAIVTCDSFAKLAPSFVAKCIANANTAILHERAKTAIFAGFLGSNRSRNEPTGQNFADVHVLIRAHVRARVTSD